MGFSRPPFHVPPKDLARWVPEDEKVFKSWKSRTGNKSASTEDFRNYIIDLNKEFDMEETFENLEVGLHAFRKLAYFCLKFPKYSLMEDLDRMYVEKDNVIVKDFIKFGDEFIRTHPTSAAELSQFDSSITIPQPEPGIDIVENCMKQDEVEIGHLSQMESTHRTPIEPKVKVKVNKSEEKLAVENATSEPEEKSDLSAKSEGMKEDATNHNVKEQLEVIGTPLSKDTPRRRCKKTKEKRKQRMLKYHQKLVEVEGLPPSRLMIQESPVLSPEHADREGSIESQKKRRLKPELPAQKQTDPEPKVFLPPPVVSSPPHLSHNNTSQWPGYSCPPAPCSLALVSPLGQNGSGISSSFNNNSMLCSGSNLVQCHGGNSCPWVTGNTQWSEARPWLGMEPGLSSCIQQSCTGLNTGINSGFSQSPTLCSCPQCCGSWAGMCTPPPSPPSPGRPAYCGSCMQFGNVYTITAA